MRLHRCFIHQHLVDKELARRLRNAPSELKTILSVPACTRWSWTPGLEARGLPEDVADAVLFALEADARCAVNEIVLMPTG